jgi:hypothetical protein
MLTESVSSIGAMRKETLLVRYVISLINLGILPHHLVLTLKKPLLK